jgi:hypothetical protein
MVLNHIGHHEWFGYFACASSFLASIIASAGRYAISGVWKIILTKIETQRLFPLFDKFPWPISPTCVSPGIFPAKCAVGVQLYSTHEKQTCE